MRSRPLPRIHFEEPTVTPSSSLSRLPQAKLQSLAFTELPLEDGTVLKRGDDRDLGLLLIFEQESGRELLEHSRQRQSQADRSYAHSPLLALHHTRLDLFRIQARPLTLSDAFATLGPGVGGGRKVMQEAERRFEWV